VFYSLLIHDCITFTSRENENTVRIKGIQISLYFIMSTISLVRHCCCFLKHGLHKWYNQCETETNVT